MAKTLEQLYEELKASETLSNELKEVIQSEDKAKLADWFKAHDCEATPAEAKDFMNEKIEDLKASGELTPEELEVAAGGSEAVVFTFTLALVVTGIVAKKAC